MKFCTKCGAEIEDTCFVCPNCGNSINNKSSKTKNNNAATPSINSINFNKSNNVNTNESLKTALMVFSILASLVGIVGLILLAIGGYQEYMFRNNYDLSGLTDAGIKWARSLSEYSNSISFLTAGGICLGIGLLLDILIVPYRKSLLNKGEK